MGLVKLVLRRAAEMVVDLTLRDAAFGSGHSSLAVARHVEVDSAAQAIDAVEARPAALTA